MMLISLLYLFTQLLVVVIAIVSALYIYFKYVVYKYWSSKGVEQAEPTFPLGDMWPFLKKEKTCGEIFAEFYLHFKKSPVVGVYVFQKPVLLINDLELIRVVLAKKFADFHDRGFYTNEKRDPLLSHLFFLNGDKWKNLRTKLSPTFTSGKMKLMFETVEEIGRELIETVAVKAKEGELVEVKDLISRFSTDVIISVAFGVKGSSLQDPNTEFRVLGRRVSNPKPFRELLVTLYPLMMNFFKLRYIDKHVTDYFSKIFKEIVDYRIAKNVTRNDFLDSIIQLMNKGYVHDDDDKKAANKADNPNGKLTMLEGASQAFVFWIAGYETSSTTVTCCLYELAWQQDLQDKLADEINRVLEEFGGVTYESVNAMPYLHKVVCETLRKYPALPMLNRICTQDTDLPGINLRVTKGTSIVIPVMGIHSDPDIYPNPEKFDPERFSEENVKGRPQYTYLPFGEGPRICIGMRFGFLQTKVGLVSLLSKYRFKPGPNTETTLKFATENVLLNPKGGVMLRIEQR